MKRMTITLPDELAAAVDQERRRQDTSASVIVRTALERLLVESRHNALSRMTGLFDAPEKNLADRSEDARDSRHED